MKMSMWVLPAVTHKPSQRGTEASVCFVPPLACVEQILVVLVGGRERSRRRHDLQRRSIPAAERSRLREEHRRRADERERSDGDPAKARVETHDSSPDCFWWQRDVKADSSARVNSRRLASRLTILHPRLRDLERRLHALFCLAPHFAADERPGKSVQPVRSAAIHVGEPEPFTTRGVANQDSQLDRRPEVVARVQHFRHHRDVCRLVSYRQVIDS